MALPIYHTALASRAQWPEGRGRAREVQADVPEGVDGGGNPLGASRGTCEQGRLCGQQSDKAPESLGGGKHLLAHLAGDVRLQPSCENLVYDTVAVVGVVGLLSVIVTWGDHGSVTLGPKAACHQAAEPRDKAGPLGQAAAGGPRWTRRMFRFLPLFLPKTFHVSSL